MQALETFVGYNKLDGIDHSPSPFVAGGIVVGIPFNLAQVVHKFGKEIIPDCLGIYHLFYEDQLIYVGMSKNLRGRLLSHMKDNDMPFNNCLWFCAHRYKENCTIADILKL